MKSCALVGLDGSIDWLCIPRFDSPSVFGAILDSEKGGRFLICPSSESFGAQQAYEPLTNVLQTTFFSDSSMVSLTDFMPCFEVQGTLVASGELHRRIQGIKGEMDVEVHFEPRPGYGAVVPKIEPVGDFGYSFSSNSPSPDQSMILLTAQKFREAGDGALISQFKVSQGEKIDLVLRYVNSKVHQPSDPKTEIKLMETCDYWRNWIAKCNFNGKWKDQVLRSALALKLLVFYPTGAIVAAPTTSLPEEIGGSRNWDYRYSWIRDSTFVIWALHSLGFRAEVDRYLDWLLAAFCLTIGNLQPMLGITGDAELTEETLENLSGYEGSSPVRVGNAAWKQFQLDLYGILIDGLYFSHKHARGVDRKVFDYLVRPMISALEENWTKPDCGIWEVRSENEHFVYSKMWAWVGVDRALKIAEERGFTDVIARWSDLRDTIKEEILSKGYDPEVQSFVRAYGSKQLDAANLLLPQLRFIPADDPKMLATIDATLKKLLTSKGFVYRYLAEDGLPGKEGAFLICSFWLINCLTMAGRLDEAERLMNTLVSYSNHLGLFSEEIEPETGNMLGNFPQAFTHMGFITAAVNLNHALEKSGRI
jgi:GH15 family glucan-1,4-alpha-glucosidase